MSEEDIQDDVPSDEPAKPSENDADQPAEKKELDPKTLLAQKKHWQEKAKKLQAELEAKSEAPESPEKPPQEDIKEWVKASNQGFSEDEIDLARRLKPELKLSEALADETVTAAINGVRATKKAKDAIPEPSQKVAIVGDKSFHELPDAEKKAHYASVVEKALAKGKKPARNLT